MMAEETKPSLIKVERDAPSQRPVEKIVTSAVIKKKPSFRKKLSGLFFGGDIQTAAEYVVHDILIPNLKNTVVEAIYAVSDSIGGGFEMLFFGERRRNRKSNVYRDAARSFISYNNMYNSGNEPRRGPSRGLMGGPAPLRVKHDFDDIVIESRVEAEEVLAQMVDLIVDYGTVTVADLYGFVGLSQDHTDQKYGWHDLRGSCTVRVPNGYMLDLPKPIPLD